MKRFSSIVLIVLLFLNVTNSNLISANVINQDNIRVVYTDFSKPNSPDTSLKEMPSLTFTQELTWDKGNIITVLPHKKRQTMLGVGGALTESAVSVINSLPEAGKQQIYDAYFSSQGSQYSLVRTHIGSCDFSTHEYTYAPDKEESIATNLENFSIADDEEDIIPAIKKALSYNSNIKVFAAPWAPPAWMKVSGKRYGDGVINVGSISTQPNHMDPKYYALYAKYFVKYIQAFKNHGIDIYSISLQNEAQNNPDWEACYWPSKEAITFIGSHLGPQLESAGLGHVKLLIWDWDKQEGALGKGDGFLTFNRTLLSSEAAPYIDGVAFHWYGPANLVDEMLKRPTWAIDDFVNIQTLRNEYPNKLFIASEGCQEKGPWLESIEPAKRYVFDMINDFQVGTDAWIDWNMVLNTQGGPLHNVQNYCHAPIMVNQTNNQITYNPAYYVLKHLSRFVRPGDVKIDTLSTIDTYKDEKGLHQVAFLDKETGKIKLIVGNITTKEQAFAIREGGRIATTSIPASTIATFEFDAGIATSYNASLNGPSLASTYEDNPVHDYRPYNAFDGNMTTRWASKWDSDQEWLQVDLGKELAIAGLDMDWQWGWKNDYAIQVSSDGTNWIPIKQVNGSQTLTNQVGDHYPITLSFAPVNGRYVRLQGIKNRQGYGYSIYNMNVITCETNEAYTIRNDVAVNKPSSASSYETNLLYNYRPSSAFDTDTNTRWASNWNTPNEWIQVDLEQSQMISGVLLNWEWGWKNIYDLQISTDGINWNTITRIDGSPDGKGTTWNNPAGNRQIIRVNFVPVEGRYMKMQGVQNKQGYGYSLYDFKVFTLMKDE